jgi:transposase
VLAGHAFAPCPTQGCCSVLARTHKQLILNWFKANKQISQAVVEAMNGNAKLAIRKARGFRAYATLRIALFHQLGALPEPHFSTHRFW